MRLGGKTEQRHLGNDTLWLFMQVIFWLLTFALIGGGNLLIVARSRTCRQHVNEVISMLTLRPIEASPTAGDTQGSEVKLNITHTSKKGKFLHPYPANPSLQFHWSCAEVTFLLHSRDTRACTSFEKLQKCSKWEVLGSEFLLEGSWSSDRDGWVGGGGCQQKEFSFRFLSIFSILFFLSTGLLLTSHMSAPVGNTPWPDPGSSPCNASQLSSSSLRNKNVYFFEYF